MNRVLAMLLPNYLKEKYENKWGGKLLENAGLVLLASGLYNESLLLVLPVAAVLSYNVVIFTITLYYCIIDKRYSNFAPEVMHTFLLVVMFLINFNIFKWRKKLFDQIFRTLEEGFYQYGDTIDPETLQEIDDTSERSRRRKNFRVKYLTIAYVLVCAGNGIFIPVMVGRFFEEEPDDMITRSTTLIHYTPFTAKSGPGWGFCILLDSLLIIICMFEVSAIDGTFVSLSEEGCNQLDIISATISNLFRRARYVFLKRYGRAAGSHQSPEFVKCLHVCMKESVNHHLAVIKYFETFTRAYALIVLGVFLTSALLLCFGGIIFFSKKYDNGIKMMFFMYLYGELFHTFIYAHYGERMSEASSGLREVVYSVEWETSSKAMRPYVTIIQSYTLVIKIKLTALGFVDYNLNTFGNVINSTFSYFNLLSASGDF